MWTLRYWQDLSERVITTGAETAGGVIASATFSARDGFDWQDLLVTAGVAMLIAGLKCLTARNVGHPENASLIK
jgi:hypothetical protein